MRTYSVIRDAAPLRLLARPKRQERKVGSLPCSGARPGGGEQGKAKGTNSERQRRPAVEQRSA